MNVFIAFPKIVSATRDCVITARHAGARGPDMRFKLCART